MAQQIVADLDKENDSKLSKAEFAAGFCPRQEEKGHSFCDDIIENLDCNGDGASVDELAAAIQEFPCGPPKDPAQLKKLCE